MPERLRQLAGHCRRHQPDQVAAYTDNHAVTWGQLADHSDRLRALLDTIDSQHIFLQHRDGADMLAALFACWNAGRTPVLNAGSDQSLEHTLRPCGAVCEGLQGVEWVNAEVPDRDPMALVLFTSGSTGTPTAVTKTFDQLDAEIALIESVWGDTVDDAVFVATVSRHHMFGLPFGLLWPVARGSAIYHSTLHFSQQLNSLATLFPLVVVTSPVQLENLPPDLDHELLASRTRLLLCAGAPLAPAAAQYCARHWIPVTEIYGSTETGALAWRQQPLQSRWQCLPGIDVRCEDSGHLGFRSPTLGIASDQWLPTADIGHLVEHMTFELQGRSDRIVKVAGKRISLTGTEARLASHPWVAEVRLVQLPERKGRLGAVVVLTAEGQDRLIDRGRRQINPVLATFLAGEVDALAIPRYWRYVSRLPRDQQGKSPAHLLHTLFDSTQQPRLPEVLSTTADDNSAEWLLNVPDTLYYFKGHFPGRGVLPGVVQLQWARHFARRQFGDLGDFVRLEVLKFQHIVQPGDTLRLKLSWRPDTAKLYFEYTAGDRNHASGRFVFTGGAS